GTNLFAGTSYGGVWRRRLSEMITSVEELSTDLPTHFSLDQNYPNPFNPATTIEYDVPNSNHVRLAIYDLLGRHVKTLVDTQQPAGHFQTTWDGADEHNLPVAVGVYFCRMEAGEYVKVIKLALVK
ncbi:MAG TPA: T9SS type A sorting domain-containing protein, partial [bacterium]